LTLAPGQPNAHRNGDAQNRPIGMLPPAFPRR
jgi:hypothetical protein